MTRGQAPACDLGHGSWSPVCSSRHPMAQWPEPTPASLGPGQPRSQHRPQAALQPLPRGVTPARTHGAFPAGICPNPVALLLTNAHHPAPGASPNARPQRPVPPRALAPPPRRCPCSVCRCPAGQVGRGRSGSRGTRTPPCSPRLGSRGWGCSGNAARGSLGEGVARANERSPLRWPEAEARAAG